MATVTLSGRSDIFPVGTTVGIYTGRSRNVGQVPGDAQIASGVVDAAGNLSVANAGILQGQSYIAYAQVSGENRYVQVRSTLDVSDTGRGAGAGTITTGAPQVTGVTVSSGAFAPGQRISTPTVDGIPAGTLIQAVASNLAAQAGVTAVAATDVLTATAHGFQNGDPVMMSALTGGAGISTTAIYYVKRIDANTFQLATTPGGTALDITTTLTAGTVTGIMVLSANATASGAATLVAEGASPSVVPSNLGVGAFPVPVAASRWQAKVRQRRQLMGTS